MSSTWLAIDQGTTSHPVHRSSTTTAASSPSTRRSTSRSSRGPAGSSTTRPRSGTTPARSIGRRAGQGGPQPARHRRRRHHQPARDRAWCGTGPPASRSTTPSSGRTPAPTPIVDELGALGGGADRYKRQGRACRWPPTSRARRSAGSSTTSTAPGRRPRPATSCFGNIDTWVLWNLTGGVDGGVHVTDVDQRLPHHAHGPRRRCPGTRRSRPRSASRCRCCRRSGPPREVYGTVRERGTAARACRSPAILGDQQAATFGQACLRPGEAKNTYGTGNFLLLNTGTQIGASRRTACSPRSATRSATTPTVYALEGSIAVTGSLVQWLRDNLGLIGSRPGDRDAGRDGRGQRRRLLRAGVLRACSRRTGAPTPAARSSA